MNYHHRKSYTAFNKIYFWTATIHKWKHLFKDNENKKIIIEYLKKLSDEKMINIYGFVIMPSHVHFLWEQVKLNGKETPFGSFSKYTAHQILKKLKVEGRAIEFEIIASNKSHQIWQRDSLAIEIYSRAVAIQKLDYIHTNPVRGIWKLAKDDLHYFYSSANFYETGVDDFGFLKDVYKVFDGD